MYDIYLPQDLINENYNYDILENGHINIYTNEPCSGWIQTEQYYFRYEVMPEHDYKYITICDKALLQGDVNHGIKINAINGHTLLHYSWFNSDFFKREDLSNILIIFLVLFIFCIYMPYRIISRWFGRWLKV